MQQFQDKAGIHTQSCLHFCIRIKTLASDKNLNCLSHTRPMLAPIASLNKNENN